MKYWRVHVPCGDRAFIAADYVRQQEGSLVFRSYPEKNSDGYPELQSMFAPGHWVTVVQVEESVYKAVEAKRAAQNRLLPPKAVPVRKVARKRR